MVFPLGDEALFSLADFDCLAYSFCWNVKLLLLRLCISICVELRRPLFPLLTVMLFMFSPIDSRVCSVNYYVLCSFNTLWASHFTRPIQCGLNNADKTKIKCQRLTASVRFFSHLLFHINIGLYCPTWINSPFKVGIFVLCYFAFEVLFCCYYYVVFIL